MKSTKKCATARAPVPGSAPFRPSATEPSNAAPAHPPVLLDFRCSGASDARAARSFGCTSYGGTSPYAVTTLELVVALGSSSSGRFHRKSSTFSAICRCFLKGKYGFFLLCCRSVFEVMALALAFCSLCETTFPYREFARNGVRDMISKAREKQVGVPQRQLINFSRSRSHKSATNHM